MLLAFPRDAVDPGISSGGGVTQCIAKCSDPEDAPSRCDDLADVGARGARVKDNGVIMLAI